MLVFFINISSTYVMDDFEEKYNISVFLSKGKMLYIGLCKVNLLHAYLQVCEIRLGFDMRNSVPFVFRACPIPGIRLTHLGIPKYKTL